MLMETVKAIFTKSIQNVQLCTTIVLLSIMDVHDNCFYQDNTACSSGQNYDTFHSCYAPMDGNGHFTNGCMKNFMQPPVNSCTGGAEGGAFGGFGRHFANQSRALMPSQLTSHATVGGVPSVDALQNDQRTNNWGGRRLAELGFNDDGDDLNAQAAKIKTGK